MKKDMYDLVISDGKIIDEHEIYTANIGVRDGKIVTITEGPISAEQVINAEGKYVSPGFIDFHSHINGDRFSAQCMLRQGATTTIGGERYFNVSIIREIETDGFLINHGFYISDSFSLRRAVGLRDPEQRATNAEISNMMELAERFFDFGVLGIHVGLEYVPGTYEKEFEEILRVAKRNDRVAVVHLRNDGYRALESLDEVLRVVKKTDASVNILHVMYMAGYDGLLDQFLERIREAREDGLDITADTGVYAAYPTLAGSQNLKENFKKYHRPDASEEDILVASGVHFGEFCTPELFHYIREKYPTTLMNVFFYDEEQIPKALKPDFMMVSTNGAYGPHIGAFGHPEDAATYPRLLSKYVRDQKVLSLQEAIGKITWQPARRFSIDDRKGLVREGMDADLTIFDLEKMRVLANFTNPNIPPEGIDEVIINGKLVLHEGEIVEGAENYGQLITI